MRNELNVGAFQNKAIAVSKCKNERVINFDADNIITKSYIDAIWSETMCADTLLCPSQGLSCLDYREYNNRVFDRTNVSSVINERKFRLLLNTGNSVVSKTSYSEVFATIRHIEPYAYDVSCFNLAWLSLGKKLKVLPGMLYYHNLRDSSYWHRTASQSTESFASIIKPLFLDLGLE